MDKGTISKFGWILITTVVVFLLVTSAFRMSDSISDKIIKSVEADTVCYTVYFDANGGSVPLDDTLVITGKPYGYLPSPTWEGKIFMGWYTAKTNGEKISGHTIFNGSGDVTLYAHWVDETE